MLPTKLTLTGAVTFAIGMMVLAIAFTFMTSGATGPRTAEAGDSVPTSTPDPTVTPDCDGSDELTLIQTGDVVALGAPVCSPTPAPTRDRSDDETPTRTATVATTAVATNTPGTAPTSPPPPATATQPAGGAGAGGVQPPNTGTGSSGTGTAALWLMLAGGLLGLTGAGAVVTGAVRRR